MLFCVQSHGSCRFLLAVNCAALMDFPAVQGVGVDPKTHGAAFQGSLLSTMSIRQPECLEPSTHKWGLRSLVALSLHCALNLAHNKVVWAWWYRASWRAGGDDDGWGIFPAVLQYKKLTFNCCNCFYCRLWCWTITLSISNLVPEPQGSDLYLVELLHSPGFC